jgi:ATP/maltotriose-dependent transcriptional regulator MalT
MNESRSGREAIMDVVRQRLLRKLSLVNPRIVALIAPAGFGKSHLARSFASSFAARAVFDCADLANPEDFARRILAALADEAPDRSAALAQQQFAFADAGADPRTSTMVSRAWSVAETRSAFTFENVESIGPDNAARRFFATLLGACPSQRTIVVCSRSPTWLQSNRFVLPHELMTFGGAELAFDRSETEAAFEDLHLPRSLLDRVEEVARGWPIAITLFRRLAIEGRLEESLMSVDDIAFDNLYDYLAGEVLNRHSSARPVSSIPFPLFHKLVRCESLDNYARPFLPR